MSLLIRCWDCGREIDPGREGYGIYTDGEHICIDCLSEYEHWDGVV